MYVGNASSPMKMFCEIETRKIWKLDSSVYTFLLYNIRDIGQLEVTYSRAHIIKKGYKGLIYD